MAPSFLRFLSALRLSRKRSRTGKKSRRRPLDELLKEVVRIEEHKKEQATNGLDSLEHSVLCKLTEDGIKNADAIGWEVAAAFPKFPNWRTSEAELRELRKRVTLTILSEEEDINDETVRKVTATVEALFVLLQKDSKS
jgi:type I restriction enzyme, R subunit